MFAGQPDVVLERYSVSPLLDLEKARGLFALKVMKARFWWEGVVLDERYS
jgi:hypothetical protein